MAFGDFQAVWLPSSDQFSGTERSQSSTEDPFEMHLGNVQGNRRECQGSAPNTRQHRCNCETRHINPQMLLRGDTKTRGCSESTQHQTQATSTSVTSSPRAWTVSRLSHHTRLQFPLPSKILQLYSCPTDSKVCKSKTHKMMEPATLQLPNPARIP